MANTPLLLRAPTRAVPQRPSAHVSATCPRQARCLARLQTGSRSSRASPQQASRLRSARACFRHCFPCSRTCSAFLNARWWAFQKRGLMAEFRDRASEFVLSRKLLPGVAVGVLLSQAVANSFQALPGRGLVDLKSLRDLPIRRAVGVQLQNA